MKTFLFLIAAIISIATNAQVSKVSLQASGLTCSMCSNSINKALKTIDFVQTVNPNIKTSTFEITFKEGSSVDFDKLKKKVEDAGFTVASFVAFVNFNNTEIKSNEPVKVGDKTFYILNAKEKSLNGAKQVRIVDKGFVSTKDFKKNTLAAPTSGNGVYNVTI
ncbi:heavy-metal-associated domain-containing protein [Sediminibacterium roseum]|uniref:Heavy-metal-associated domain-containing protein n=1 Tax=Sediminibacterium roseum TaxID=1978412 RepID=A0ABW9ZS05_9BACT|nr:heavy-metal-associated domain-containing protein [Sediminibacterium roseum]NCI49237.1 heavy-metal-associated domain-containing protein [Sediminibacterium roseum]